MNNKNIMEMVITIMISGCSAIKVSLRQNQTDQTL